jgi:putative ABC transport system ATP-binding protein
MIRLNKVSKTYRTDKVETLAVKDIDLHVKHGEFVALMGPSGCGKSTLLNLIGLLDRPGEGSVEVDGIPITRYRDKQVASMRNSTFGFIFQSFHLIPDLRVIDNVEVPLLYRSMSGSERRRMAREALEKVGLGARMDHYPNQLSGGQQQRVAIARALINEPSILLADEPTGNLDTRTSIEVMDIFQRLNMERGITVVLITHEMDIAEHGTRIVKFRDGKIQIDQQITNRRMAGEELKQLPPADDDTSHLPASVVQQQQPVAH